MPSFCSIFVVLKPRLFSHCAFECDPCTDADAESDAIETSSFFLNTGVFIYVGAPTFEDNSFINAIVSSGREN